MDDEWFNSKTGHSAILFIAGLAYGVFTRKPVLTTIVIAFAASLVGHIITTKNNTETTNI
jgi:hypothetical protein